MDEATHQLEEFKHIGNAILEVDKRILQILMASTAIGVTLLSAIGGFYFGKQGETISVIHAYGALAPNLIIVPAFYLILAQRIDMMRLGSYRFVFFEEQNNFQGWETRLKKLREQQNEKDESHDPLPWIFWTVFLASAALFCYAVSKSCAPFWHILALALPIAFILWAHIKWNRVVDVNLHEHIKLWRGVKII